MSTSSKFAQTGIQTGSWNTVKINRLIIDDKPKMKAYHVKIYIAGSNKVIIQGMSHHASYKQWWNQKLMVSI
jgi:hypothetical protein